MKVAMHLILTNYFLHEYDNGLKIHLMIISPLIKINKT